MQARDASPAAANGDPCPAGFYLCRPQYKCVSRSTPCRALQLPRRGVVLRPDIEGQVMLSEGTAAYEKISCSKYGSGLCREVCYGTSGSCLDQCRQLCGWPSAHSEQADAFADGTYDTYPCRRFGLGKHELIRTAASTGRTLR